MLQQERTLDQPVRPRTGLLLDVLEHNVQFEREFNLMDITFHNQ